MRFDTHASSRRPRWLLGLLVPALLIAAFGLFAAACGDDDDDSDNGGAAPAGDATDSHGDELTATEAWARFPTDETGAVYLHLSGGAEDDALLSAKVDFAMMAQIHETVTSGSTSSMRQVEKLEVPAGGHVDLEPGGYHIMLMNIQQVPEVGSTFNLELEFEHAGTMTIPVEVRAFE